MFPFPPTPPPPPAKPETYPERLVWVQGQSATFACFISNAPPEDTEGELTTGEKWYAFDHPAMNRP